MSVSTKGWASIPAAGPMAMPELVPLGPVKCSTCVAEGKKIVEIIAPVVKASARAERLAYSIQEAADLLGVNYFSIYRLIQRGKLKVCRALRGKLLIAHSELLKLLKAD